MIASGDLANRGRGRELKAAKALLDRLPAPTLTVPGNHDIPYTVPARFTTPWKLFDEVFGTTDPAAADTAGRRLRAQLRPPLAPPGRTAGRCTPAGSGTRLPGWPRGSPPRRRLSPPPRRGALARIAEVPAEAPRSSASNACRRGNRARARRPHPPEHGGRTPCVRSTRRSARRIARPLHRTRLRPSTTAPARRGERPPRRALDDGRDLHRDANLAEWRLRGDGRATVSSQLTTGTIPTRRSRRRTVVPIVGGRCRTSQDALARRRSPYAAVQPASAPRACSSQQQPR